MYTCTYKYNIMHAHTCIYIYIYMYMYVYMYVCTMHILHVHVCTHVHVRIYVHVYMYNVHTFMHTFISGSAVVPPTVYVGMTLVQNGIMYIH